MNPQFNNMIQVLAYFADQCDMFQPMLEGVTALRDENDKLKTKLELSNILQNRMQLQSTYSADYANFGVETVRVAQASEKEKVKSNFEFKQNISTNDLILLFRQVINVGKENYDRTTMEEMLDFYSMTEVLDFDVYIELWDLIDLQHQEPVVPEPEPEIPLTPLEPSIPVEPEVPPTEPDVPSEGEAGENTPEQQIAKKKKFLFK